MGHSIYRVEIASKLIGDTQIGNGVYANCPLYDSLEHMYERHRNGLTHPGMRDDFPNYESVSSFYCACLSLDGLQRWFDGFLEDLIKLGCDIVEYIVSDVVVAISKKQCFFKNDYVIKKEIITDKIFGKLV